MSAGMSSRQRIRSALKQSAFTLIEMMGVIGIIAILMMLVVPAFTTLKSAGDVTSAAYTIKGVLEQARTYAKANNTYTWVGFYEENTTDTAPTNAAPPYTGKGRVVLATAYSNDGTKIYWNGDSPATLPNTAPASPAATPQAYVKQLGTITRIEKCHITDIGAPPLPTPNPSPSPASLDGRPSTPYTYAPFTTDAHFNRINSDAADAARFPFSAQNYTFRKTVLFAPSGEVYVTGQVASNGATGYVVVPILEIGVEPTHGTAVDTNSPNRVAVQVTGMAGAVKIYRK